VPVVAAEVLLNPTSDDNAWAVEVLQNAGTPQAAVAAARGATVAVTSGQWSEAQNSMRDLILEQLALGPSGPDVEQRLVAKLRDCPVSQETIAGEVGQPLFTRTVTKAVAVATAATAEAQEMPTVLKPALGAVRKLTLLAYRLAAVNGGNARKLAVTGVALAVLGFVMLFTGYVVVGLTGVVVIGAGVYLVLLVSWRNIHHFWGWVGFLAAVAAVTVGIALFSDDVRGTLFDTPKAKKGQGWVSEHGLPWLRNPCWRAPVVWFGLVLLIVGVATTIVVLSKKSKKKKEAAAAPVGQA
jgi:hypothetical protein